MKTAIGAGVIVGLGVVFTLLGIYLFLFEYIDYAFARTYYNDAPTITFKTFKIFYALNRINLRLLYYSLLLILTSYYL